MPRKYFRSDNKINFVIYFDYLSLIRTFVPRKGAQMVELVDTRDLKSLDHNGRTGSSPVPGTRRRGKVTARNIQQNLDQAK